MSAPEGSPGRPPNRLVKICLHEGVRVEGAGHVKTTWTIKQGEEWILASQYPGAQTEMMDAGPGTVWERYLELEVPVGALVVRTNSAPGQGPRRDVLSYLTRETREVARRVVRQFYRVAPNGDLTRTQETQ